MIFGVGVATWTYLDATFGADGAAAKFAVVPPRAKDRKARLSTHEANLHFRPRNTLNSRF